MVYSIEGVNPIKAIDDEVKRKNDIMRKSQDLLPIYYTGSVPNEYKKEYDSEEYLQMIYEKCGIKIIEEYNYLLYKVELPDGFKIKYDGNCGVVKNSDDIDIITFIKNDKFYAPIAEVVIINERAINNIFQQKETQKKLIK